MRTPTTTTDSIVTPSAAHFRDRAHNLAQFAHERDSKRATLLALELRQLADILAASEAVR
jgi:hypothetical protein